MTGPVGVFRDLNVPPRIATIPRRDNAAYAETKKRLLAFLPKQEEMAPSMPSKKRKKKTGR